VREHAGGLGAHPYTPGDAAPATDAGRKLRQLAHQATARVTEDAVTAFRFNTAISALMEYTNALTGVLAADTEPVARSFALKRLIVLLAPFAPHLAEEWWGVAGESPSVFHAAWPSFDPQAALEDAVEVPVQINGKHRVTLVLKRGLDQEATKSAALADGKVAELIAGRTIKRAVVIPNKLINLVV